MQVEGKGLVAPAGIGVPLTPSDITRLQDIARRRDEFRGYRRSADQWKQGIIKNPTLAGLFGEEALCKWLNGRIGLHLAVNDKLLKKGDGGNDIDVAGMSLQVKTLITSKRPLIRRDHGWIRPLDCDAFVFAKADYGSLVVRLIGWIWASHVPDVGVFAQSPIGDWWNIAVESIHLQPMSRLIDEIKGRLA
jgi:hypothetical protein